MANNPPWSEPSDMVTENADGSLSVGQSPTDSAKERAQTADTQIDRIEAKMDYLIANMGGR